ncbi:MAG: TonB-dependent receptor, partial [Alphaproteobacteria bacterium PA3]
DGCGGKGGALGANRAGAVDVVVGAAYERRGVFRDGEQRRVAPDGTQGDLQDSDSLSVFAKAGVELGEGIRLEAMGQRFHLQGEGDLIAVAGNRLTGLSATGAPGLAPGEAPENLSRKWGVNASWERGVGPLNLVIGVDLLNDHTVQKLAATGRAWVPPTDYRSIAPFTQVNLALWGGKVRLAGGARWENVRIDVP